jgi:hydrogenase nickel incorporation protein HypB
MTVRAIKVYQDLMGANEEWAAKTRALLRQRSLLMLNLIGSPGSGKTTLLEKSVDYLRSRHPFAVLEGDVETTNDAERLHALDVPVSQLLSGGSCHLEAKLVHHALVELPLDDVDVVFVENVGNMVCPAEFDIGEMAKVAVLSVTEGEDKPLKYPLLFREAKAAVLSKQDLLPHLNFDVAACRRNIREVNGNIPVFDVAATTGEGIEAWGEWVAEQVEQTRNRER